MGRRIFQRTKKGKIMETFLNFDEHQGWFLVATFIMGFIVGFVAMTYVQKYIDEKDEELMGGKHDN